MAFSPSVCAAEGKRDAIPEKTAAEMVFAGFSGESRGERIDKGQLFV